MKKIIALVLMFLFVLAAAASAEIETKFYGYQWLRYDYKFVGPNPSSNGFYVPRTYLRYQVKDFELGYDCNLTIDINNDKSAQKVAVTGTAGTVDWGVYLKYGYIQLNKIPFLMDAGLSLQAGVIPMHFGIVGTWQYPLIEKALEDRQGYVGSADQGIALIGTFPENWGNYGLAVYNGTGFKAMETNMEKAYVLNIQVSPIQEVYARASHYRTLTLDSAASRYDVTSAVLGFKAAEFEGFFQYVVRNASKDKKDGMSGCGEGYSMFVSYDIAPFLGLLMRYDITDPDTFVRKDERNTFMFGTNVKIAKGAIVLQLNYELEAAKFKGMPDFVNENLYSAQVKWVW